MPKKPKQIMSSCDLHDAYFIAWVGFENFEIGLHFYGPAAIFEELVFLLFRVKNCAEGNPNVRPLIMIVISYNGTPKDRL